MLDEVFETRKFKVGFNLEGENTYEFISFCRFLVLEEKDRD